MNTIERYKKQRNIKEHLDFSHNTAADNYINHLLKIRELGAEYRQKKNDNECIKEVAEEIFNEVDKLLKVKK